MRGLVKAYYDEDADLSVLEDKTMAIIGYGNQGRAQGLNLRDSGLRVIVGNVRDAYWEKAVKEGFQVYSIHEAAELGDILFMLVPDEVQREVYENHVKDGLKEGKALVFAHGYNIHYGFIDPPDYVDVLLVAPRMIGTGVRGLYLKGSGAPAFVGVYRDASGEAWKRTLAIAKAIGATRAGAIESSFAEETEIDHFMEQATWAAIGRILQLSFEVLVEAGYPPEIVALELYGSGEAAEVMQKMAEVGFFKQLSLHSRTSQYAQLTRGPRMITNAMKERMRWVVSEIKNGIFAREWEKEQALGYPVFNKAKEDALKHPINEAEQKIKKLIKR